MVKEPPTENTTSTTSLKELETSKRNRKSVTLATRKSSRTKSFDISKKEYLCQLINVSNDDDNAEKSSSSLQQLKNGIYDSLLKTQHNSLRESNVINLVTESGKLNSESPSLQIISGGFISDEETDVLLKNETETKIGQEGQTPSKLYLIFKQKISHSVY